MPLSPFAKQLLEGTAQVQPQQSGAPDWVRQVAGMTESQLAELNRPAPTPPQATPAQRVAPDWAQQAGIGQAFVSDRVAQAAPIQAPKGNWRSEATEADLSELASLPLKTQAEIVAGLNSGEFKPEQIRALVASSSGPTAPTARGTGGGGPAVLSGYGPGAGGYYGPDYLANLVRAREEGRISEKQFDAGAMAYNRAMTGTSAGLELAAGRQDAALQQRAMGMDAETARAYADAQAKENEALTIAAQKDAERAEAFEARRQQFLQDAERRQNEMDALASEIRSTKIDPNAYWANRNGFSTMLSLFAVGLGGYVEGKSQGRVQNKALAMVENAIDRDVAAQKANLENKRGAAEVMRGAYGMARQRLGDEQAAEDYSRSLLWDQFAKVAQRYRGEARTKELASSAAKIELQANAISKQFENRAKIAFARADEARRAAAASAPYAAAAADLRRRKQVAEIASLEAKAAKDLAESGVGGLGAKAAERVVRLGTTGNELVIAPTNQAAEELASRQAAANRLSGIIDRMNALGGEGAGVYAPGAITGVGKQLAALRSEAAAALARSRAGGKTTEQDERRALDDLPLPASIMDTGEAAVLAQLKQQAQQAVFDYSQSVNARQVREETVETPMGAATQYSLSRQQPKSISFTRE